MDNVKILMKNKKARHEYFIEETYEAGLALVGSEVKSVRAGSANIKEVECACRPALGWIGKGR